MRENKIFFFLLLLLLRLVDMDMETKLNKVRERGENWENVY